MQYDSMEQCDNLNYGSTKQICYGYFAAKENNLNFCQERFKDEKDNCANCWQGKTSSIQDCVAGYAIYKNDVSFCNQFEDIGEEASHLFKQRCLSEYYIAKKEINMCKELKNKYIKGGCEDRVTFSRENALIIKYANWRGYLK